MFIPKQLRSNKAKRKVQAMSATMLLTLSSIGCSLGGEQVMPTPTTSATRIRPMATQIPPTATKTLPTATKTPPTATKTLPTATKTPPTATKTPPTATKTPPTATKTPPTATPETVGLYRDGSYLGDAIRTDHWGTTQVKAIIEGGMLTNVEIVQYAASKSHSVRVSLGAFPRLISEAVTNQSANVDIVSRATDTSIAFMRSLDTALQDAAVENQSAGN